MDELYIDTESGRIYLTWEQENSIRKQIIVENAMNLLDSLELNAEVLSETELTELAEALDAMYFDNVGEKEFNVVAQFNRDHDNILNMSEEI